MPPYGHCAMAQPARGSIGSHPFLCPTFPVLPVLEKVIRRSLPKVKFQKFSVVLLGLDDRLALRRVIRVLCFAKTNSFGKCCTPCLLQRRCGARLGQASAPGGGSACMLSMRAGRAAPWRACTLVRVRPEMSRTWLGSCGPAFKRQTRARCSPERAARAPRTRSGRRAQRCFAAEAPQAVPAAVPRVAAGRHAS